MKRSYGRIEQIELSPAFGTTAPPPMTLVQVAGHVRRLPPKGEGKEPAPEAVTKAVRIVRTKWLQDHLEEYNAAQSTERARRAEHRNAVAEMSNSEPMTTEEINVMEVFIAKKLHQAGVAHRRAALAFDAILRAIVP